MRADRSIKNRMSVEQVRASAASENMSWQEIALTQGKVALVDEGDFEMVSRYKWCFEGRYAEAYDPATGKKIRLHRLIMGLDGPEVDHINLDKLDCRRDNLRHVTRPTNAQNRRKRLGSRGSFAGGASSRFIGVSLNKRRGRRWYACIRVHGKTVSLGQFDDETEAARAYDRAALSEHGPSARINNV